MLECLEDGYVSTTFAYLRIILQIGVWEIAWQW